MEVERVVNEYRYAILDLAPKTQRWYLERLEPFAKWCRDQGITDIVDLKALHIRRYMAEIREQPNQRTGKPLSTYTIKGNVQVVKGFLSWCAKEDLIPDRLAGKIEMPKVEIKVIETFTEDHIRRLFAACGQEATPVLVARDKAILCVLLDTGIRASELTGLTLDRTYLTPNDAYLKVLGKGRKQREVGLGNEARSVLHRYISRYREAPQEERCVFINRMRQPMSPDGLDQMLYRLRDWGHVKGVRVSAHTFRHTYALNYLRDSGDIYKLSRLLGHTSVAVTENYLRAFNQRDARKGLSVLDNMRQRA